MNVKISKTFTTRNGAVVEVDGTLELERELWLDGDTAIVPVCEIRVDVVTPKHGIQGGYVHPMTDTERKYAPAGYNWVCGRLGLTNDQAEIIRSVWGELEAHPAWLAKQARIANEKAGAAEYASHQAYPGWCNKCHSYCYGDCEA